MKKGIVEEPVIDVEKEKLEILKRYRSLLRASTRTRSDKDRKLIRKAFDVANEAHKGMRRKTGEPYIYHPIAVAKIVAYEIGLGTTSIIAALLHDVVEDTAWTIADLEQEGFPHEVIEAIKALTKLDGESRPTAARRAAMNPIARLVKLADVKDNMDLGRIKNPTAKDYERLKEYEHVREILLSAGA